MESVLEPLKEFSKNSVRLVKRCTKPDRKGMLQINLIFFEGLMWVLFSFCGIQAVIIIQLKLLGLCLQNSTRSAYRQHWGSSSWASLGSL